MRSKSDDINSVTSLEYLTKFSVDYQESADSWKGAQNNGQLFIFPAYFQCPALAHQFVSIESV